MKTISQMETEAILSIGEELENWKEIASNLFEIVELLSDNLEQTSDA